MESSEKISGQTRDLALPFQLESCPIRGRLVRLGPALDVILRQHAYPAPVAGLLGEATAIAAALGAALKYEGLFTFQVKSEGAVRLLVADVTSDGGLRAYAQFDPARLASEAHRLLGKGFLAFTVDQTGKDDRYQGIVELKTDSLAEAVQHYFRQSEQIPTGLIAAIRQTQDATGATSWRGACLMLQQMPRAGGAEAARYKAPRHDAHDTFHSDLLQEDDWLRVMTLMQTCTLEELTDPTLSPETLLYRLFHEEGVRVFDPQTFRHQCRCTPQRVADMLRSLPRAEVESLAENGLVDVTCEFCNHTYSYNAQQRDELYKDSE